MIAQHHSRYAKERDGTGYTALHYAVLLNEPRIVDLLLNTDLSNANILNNEGLSPFHLAARLDHDEIFQLFVRFYLDCCSTLSGKGRNALHVAVEDSGESVIAIIVNDRMLSEVMLNQQDEDGNTPLHIAGCKGDEKMQNVLLGGQVTVLPLKDKEGLKFRQERKQKKKKEKMQSKLVKGMEDFQSSLLVKATLITTVTFTAAFTLPGGYNGSDPNQGMATLAGMTGFDVFLVTNTISMCSSMAATTALILFSLVFSTEKRFNTLKVAIAAIALSTAFLLVAFAAGVWVVIGSQRRWLAVFIAVVTCCTPLCLALLIVYIIFGSGVDDVE